MAQCFGCGNFYTPISYENDEGICNQCRSSSTGYGYASKEWVGGNVTSTTNFYPIEEKD